MTCIVALKQDDQICMGADSAGVSGLDIRMRRDPKLYRVGPALIGFTSSFRMGQLLGYQLSLPDRHPNIEVDKWMNTTFIDEVRSTLKRGGYAASHEGVESGGTFLVAYAGKIFTVYDDYQVAESTDGYTACGCGEDYALASLHTTQGLPSLDIKQRVISALETAEYFSGGVRGPFKLEFL